MAYQEIDLFDGAHWGTWAEFYITISVPCTAIINAINQSSFNQSEDSSPSINQFNQKGSKYPINQVRAPWIDQLIDSKSENWNF
jgi:hypothetical protein